MKECGGLLCDLAFRVSAENAAENRLLKKKAAKELIKKLTGVFERESIDNAGDFEKAAKELYKNGAASDGLIFLFYDIACAALVFFTAKRLRDRKEETNERIRLTCAQTEKLFSLLKAFDFDGFYRSVSAVDRTLRKRNYLSYAASDRKTRAEIRRLVLRFAKRKKLSEKDAAAVVREDEPALRQKRRAALCVSLRVMLFVLLAGAAAVLCGPGQALFLSLPILLLSGEMMRFFASLVIRPEPLFSLEEAPVKERVVAVLTVLITSKEDVARYGRALEKIYLLNRRDEGVLFGLLCDLKDAGQRETPGDGALIAETEKEIARLNKEYKNRFCLFFRERQPVPGEGYWSGKERKRGAIIDLARLLTRGEDRFIKTVLPPDYKKNTHLLLTLDADTGLRCGAVRKMYAVMRHPYNRPVVRNGVVVSGCGVLQPRMTPSVASVGKTPFATLLSGAPSGGQYSAPVFDYHQSVFSRGAFCGKGMIDLDAFEEVIDGAFPEKRILSHDLLEGTRLRCLNMTELVFLDSFPSTASSYYKRKHRWLRGDYQSFPFALYRLPFTGKEKKRNPVDFLSKYMIASNAFRAAAPAFSLISLFLARPFDESTCAFYLLFSTGYILFPFAVTILLSARNAGRRFYSRVLQDVLRSFLLALYELSALAYEAWLSADALARVLYRSLVSHKKLLEWVTASENEAAKKSRFTAFLSYLRSAFPSLALTLVLLLTARGGIIRLLSVLFLIFPFVSFRMSLPYRKKKAPAKKDRERLTDYIKKSFSYYERFVCEKDRFLPPDNVRETPSPAVAHRTSPTNIALYLVSVGAMHDLALLPEEVMLEKLGRTIETLESLPKYRGHLYNWYDTQTLDILGAPFISTVDSGNYVMALVYLSQKLKEVGSARAKELRAQIDGLLDRTDFSFLYDEKKELLSIGFDPVSGKRCENCYDLLASEARSAYCFAIAKDQIPVESWGKLGRPVTLHAGHFGILSWSGTAFEYFMPALFLPVYDNTLLHEMLCFAYDEQQNDRTGKLWGRSEAGYFAFDNEMNYQYKAFGCATLAIDPAVKNENVIAPYASFLTLPFAYAASMSNLKRLEEAGAYGEYGFYDAIDFTPARVGRGNAVIRSYMAHHIGMSIAGAANAQTNGAIVRRILADREIAAFEELYEEGVPCDAPRAVPAEKRRSPKPPAPPLRFQKRERECPENVLLSGGAMRALYSGERGLSFAHSDVLITPPDIPEKPPRRTFSVEYSACGQSASLPQGCRAYYVGRQLRLIREEKAYALMLAVVTPPGGGAVLHFESTADDRNARVVFSLPLVLSSVEEYRTHPAFSGLLTECADCPGENALLFHRRYTDEKRRSFYLLLAFADGAPFDAVSSYDDLPAPGGALTEPLCRRTGPLRIPYALLRRTLPENGKTDLILLCGGSREKLLSRLREMRRKEATDALFRAVSAEAALERKTMPFAEYEDRAFLSYVSLLIEGVRRFRLRRLTLPALPIGELWKYGISGDLPVFTFLIPEEKLNECQKRTVKGLLRAHAFLVKSGVPLDLVFLRADSDRYHSPARKEFSELLGETVGFGRPTRAGGVYLITDRSAKTVLPSFSRVFLTVGRDCIFSSFKNDFLSCLEPACAPDPRAYEKRGEKKTSLGDRTVTVEGSSGAPSSMIYCGHHFGTLLTNDSLGFTWVRNAGEFRLSPFCGDEVQRPAGERMTLSVFEKEYDLCADAQQTVFGPDCARYRTDADGLYCVLSVGVHPRFPVKILSVFIRNDTDRHQKGELRWHCEPCLGSVPDGAVTSFHIGDALFFKRTALKGEAPFCAYLTPEKKPFDLAPGKSVDAVFLLGACPLEDDRLFYTVTGLFSHPDGAAAAYKEYARHYEYCRTAFALRTPDGIFEKTFGGAVPYQTLTARLLGRTGWAQPGGAYGFRDQLQDAVNMLPYDPQIAKIQIFRSAAHQYAEGDVMHWWHVTAPERGLCDAGVRTACSDDLLFLPYAVSRYIEATNDRAILDAQIRFLDAPPLSGDARYERPRRTARRESLYGHCMRAFGCAASRKDKGLFLMGSGDWNDGLSEVRGGSVWLTQFFVLTAGRFLPFASKADAELLRNEIASARAALAGCFERNRYLRAFFPDGKALGREGNEYCAIDLLPQAFAVFIDQSPQSRTAINEAYGRLWDPAHRLFRLFAPAYSASAPFPGYLGGYCPGFRENGGQYTHAALWGAIALLRAGEYERGYEVLRACDPAYRAGTDPAYATEPYALAGDVYAAKGFEGRGGWSQYTGAAGWFLYAVLEELIGYKPQKGGFTLAPALSRAFPSFALDVKNEGAVWHIEGRYEEAPARGGLERTYVFTLDGQAHKGAFLFDGKNHTVTVTVSQTA